MQDVFWSSKSGQSGVIFGKNWRFEMVRLNCEIKRVSKFYFAPAVTAALIGISASASADSSVNFANGSSVGVPLVLGADGVGIHSANYVAQLFESTDGGASFSAVGTTSAFFNVATTSFRAGVWKSQSITLAGVNPGSIVSFKVAVWDSSIFSTYADASEWVASSFPIIPGKIVPGDVVQMGVTPAFSYNAPPAGDLNPADFNLVNFHGLTLTRYPDFSGVPEPTTTAMTIVGVVGFLFFYRRRFKARAR